MVTLGIPPRARDPRMTVFRAGAIASAVLSGSYALAAFIFGSALEFGVALALCAAWSLTADFVVWTLERDHAARRPAAQDRSEAPTQKSQALRLYSILTAR